jgi:hypothetical protein
MRNRKPGKQKRVTWARPKDERRMPSLFAPDLYENGKLRRNRSILDYAKSLERPAKR